VSAASTGREASPAELASYTAILAHAELELELAGRGDVEALEALGSRWEELVGGLPATPPQEALGLLERAALVHERTRVELLRVRGALLSEFDTARRARRTAAGYAGELAARPRLNRSA
jgi:hypothetical protein